MRTLRRRGFLGPAAWLLAAIFLAAQVFACCQANARMGRAFSSLFARASQPAHACCAKATPVAPPVKPGCAGECCIQSSAQHAPQLASEPSDVPQFTAPAVLLAPFMEAPVALGECSPRVIDSGPPLYLRTLRLLV